VYNCNGSEPEAAPEVLFDHQAFREHRAPTMVLVARELAKIPPPPTR
jgi:hypothetical protein